jgi:hypothetical protein
MAPRSKSRGNVYTLTLRDVGVAKPVKPARSISAAVDPLVRAVQSASTDAELRHAKAALERAIELYIDRTVVRILSRDIELLM